MVWTNSEPDAPSAVSAQDVAAGFYSRLYALQGPPQHVLERAAFQAHDSALLWQCAETLLPQIAA